jgi:hypothetical protein
MSCGASGGIDPVIGKSGYRGADRQAGFEMFQALRCVSAKPAQQSSLALCGFLF